MEQNGLEKVFDGANKLAYATSIDGIPNLRIVNFVWEKETPNIIYFASVRDSKGVQEFLSSEKIAFSTVPEEGNAHVASNNAVGIASKRTLAEMKDKFLADVPDFDKVLALIGDQLDVYEIHIQSTEADLGLGNGTKQVKF
ncbi:hypothetical protein [Secundilactobacillus malefermentans]|uniref:Pyridoxamine 5'-phosphate oxidase-like domain-containing protein n=1 Tax=Secundilactobacillus malefermentans TaxID=176292 RepID=A0A4R5NR89_9LACO|nr:hypothetical protein [Secundilactobacillus malefermentans]KRM57697.1 hypothetical protein FD44_GL001019 [Secundilactobacillus malefermentans DSM 5705 = KCTC 3548]QEA32135.1 hypothetical protein FGL90_08035 [Secundilactobacillus malefermentans]TDG78865.1 hypothetical protein C5L31_000525 [Secundilactobacillus malefermentans]